MGSRQLRVHARLASSDRADFGLHVWGPVADIGTSWDKALAPAGEDWFGPYFDVPLAPAVPASFSGPALGLILHRGDDKKATLELFDAAQVPETAIWFGHDGAGFASIEPEAGGMPAGDLKMLGARAHWLTPQRLAWRAAKDAPAGGRFFLHGSADAKLRDGGAPGVKGEDEVHELTKVAPELTEELAAAHPYLKGCALLEVPEAADARALCRKQLAVAIVGKGGETLDCSGVQVGALLDELFAYDGPLGCTATDGGGAALALWAPTALDVTLLLYDKPRGGACAEVAMAGEDGVWRAAGGEAWWGKYYCYRVRAYHPATGKVEVMESADPYCHACAADAKRSLLLKMEAAEPEGWRAHAAPAFAHRAAAVVYELHVRDFSMADEAVSAKGKYSAFEEEGTAGDAHLKRLAQAGVTHVQLLPTYDFGSVPERAEDRREQEIPRGLAPDSEEPQRAAAAVADVDGFNWGYDPVLYNVPEGSYASDPDGEARVLEHRRMVMALHKKGLRVVLDVVYNHTHGSGAQGAKSVLDKCVPGYYHRRAESGAYECSTCMNNTCAERRMFERFVVDSLLHWAVQYRADGFRFDLMGHLPLRCIERCRRALDALTEAEHGVEGSKVLLHGEGWEFGEIAEGQRGTAAVQRCLAGSGVGSFNDKLRDAALGGSPFSDLRTQGFATGLGLRGNAELDYGTEEEAARNLLVAGDKIRTALAAGMTQVEFEEDCDGKKAVLGAELHGGGVAYASAPVEMLNYVSAHDNETLYDNMVWKMPPSLFSPEERMRASWLCTSLVALAHGVPFFHAGDELLRSKSLDRDSYNSGDWFNLLDFTGKRSAFGTGLPVESKNGGKWEMMRPLLRDASLRPTEAMAAASSAKFCELLKLRRSTALLGLLEAEDVLAKVRFPCSGPKQLPGVLVMEVRNGPPAKGGGDLLCRRLARVLVVFSARLEESRLEVPPGPEGAGPLKLHPLQAASEDSATRTACVEAGELVLPAQTAVVFVEPLPGQEAWDGEA